MSSLFDVLAGWRRRETAFARDISKMFNQFALHPDDQKYHLLAMERWRN